MVNAVFDLDQYRYRSPPVGATLRRFLGSIEPAPQEPLAVGKTDEASDRVRCTDDRAYRYGTASASA